VGWRSFRRLDTSPRREAADEIYNWFKLSLGLMTYSQTHILSERFSVAPPTCRGWFQWLESLHLKDSPCEFKCQSFSIHIPMRHAQAHIQNVSLHTGQRKASASTGKRVS
jgi:hypothetical protein